MILPQPNYKSALVSVLKSPLKKMCLHTIKIWNTFLCAWFAREIFGRWSSFQQHFNTDIYRIQSKVNAWLPQTTAAHSATTDQLRHYIDYSFDCGRLLSKPLKSAPK